MKILLAEDNDHMRNSLVLCAQKLGASTVAVCDGEEAWELLVSGQRFDLIITDNNMLVMDGIELIRLIRRHDSTPGQRIVMYSADQDEKLHAEVKGLGAAFESKSTPALSMLRQYIGATVAPVPA